MMTIVPTILFTGGTAKCETFYPAIRLTMDDGTVQLRVNRDTVYDNEDAAGRVANEIATIACDAARDALEIAGFIAQAFARPTKKEG